ncbi:putative quinol monooxygenase [Vreelandella sp. GE22]
MPKVTLEGFITVPAAELEAFKEALVTHKTLTLAEPGCLIFEVIQDQSDPCRFKVFEAFIDRVAFDYHQRRVATSDWGKQTRNAVRHYEIVE